MFQVEYIARQHEVDNIYSFYFKPLKKTVWKPGQHITLKVPHKEKYLTETFSISSCPSEEKIRITTRYFGEKSSDFKKSLFKLDLGRILFVKNPKGSLVINAFTKHHVLITGGIGITPFRSIVKELSFSKIPVYITILYQSKDINILFKKELDSIARNNKNIAVRYFVDNKKIDANILKEFSGKPNALVCGISGPEGFVKNTEKILHELNFSKRQIKMDKFEGL